MASSVQISVRLPKKIRCKFAELCSQHGLTVSEAVHRMIDHALERKTTQPGDDIWDILSAGQPPAGYKNGGVPLPELSKEPLPKENGKK